MKNNINFQLASIEANLEQLLMGIPVGAAYFLLKSKTQELETIYYQQAKLELQEAVTAQQSSQSEPQEPQVLDQGKDEATPA